MRRCPAFVAVAGLSLAGATAQADAPAAPVAAPIVELEIDGSVAGNTAVWEAMRKGNLSPEEAWQKGILDAAGVQAGLVRGLAGGEDDESKTLRVRLGQVLVQRAPETVTDTAKLPKQVQLVVADYYASVGDEKAAPLYEAVLGQTTAPYEQGLLAKSLGDFWSQKKHRIRRRKAGHSLPVPRSCRLLEPLLTQRDYQ